MATIAVDEPLPAAGRAGSATRNIANLLAALLVACLPLVGRSKRLMKYDTSTSDFDHTDGDSRNFIQLNQLLLLLSIFWAFGCCIGLVAMWIIWWSCGTATAQVIPLHPFGHEPATGKNKMTQSQTTYTLKSSNPRFTPLHDYGHGAWEV